MNEIRCPKCNKKLAEIDLKALGASRGIIRIKCHRCGYLTTT